MNAFLELDWRMREKSAVFVTGVIFVPLLTYILLLYINYIHTMFLISSNGNIAAGRSVLLTPSFVKLNISFIRSLYLALHSIPNLILHNLFFQRFSPILLSVPLYLY